MLAYTIFWETGYMWLRLGTMPAIMRVCAFHAHAVLTQWYKQASTIDFIIIMASIQYRMCVSIQYYTFYSLLCLEFKVKHIYFLHICIVCRLYRIIMQTKSSEMRVRGNWEHNIVLLILNCLTIAIEEFENSFSVLHKVSARTWKGFKLPKIDLQNPFIPLWCPHCTHFICHYFKYVAKYFWYRETYFIYSEKYISCSFSS